ncbi:GNAT family N-acetyltransferase [Vicingaceae bacterium]|nr:GNAT family N-acetyltransferase [Vicingaceae bacterium]
MIKHAENNSRDSQTSSEQDRQISIRSIVEQDFQSISAIHRQGFPHDLFAQLGPSFLTNVFYPRLFGSANAVGLLAEIEAQPVAFVCFNSDNELFTSLVKQQFGKIFLLSLCRIWNLRFVLNCLVSLIVMFLRRKPPEEMGTELTLLIVHPDYQGMRIGAELVQQGFRKLEENGEKSCWLKTMSKTTRNVRFYEKQGFEIYQQFCGRTYLQRAI